MTRVAPLEFSSSSVRIWTFRNEVSPVNAPAPEPPRLQLGVQQRAVALSTEGDSDGPPRTTG